jgi:phosphatidylglycerol lysyltransferase
MKSRTATNPFKIFLKERSIPFVLENRKIIIQFIFTILFISLGIWYVRHEKAELVEVKNVLNSAHANWVAIGIALTVIYVLLMGLMYVFAFRSIGCKVKLSETSILFLKRNLISIFLPAGGVSSLAFFAGNIESRGITKTQVHFASSIYGFLSIFSVVLVAIPAFLFAVTQGASSGSDWLALLVVVLILSLIVLIYYSIKKKGKIYLWLIKIAPKLEVFLDDMQNHTIQMKYFYFTLLSSIMVELVGIVHVYISMIALGIAPSLFAATMGYLIAVIFLLVSPFLRGLGAIEVSMTLIFTKFGFSNIESIAITFLFRFFEFWLPILAGIISFLNKGNKYLMRMIPAILLFVMGLINIISFLSPGLGERLEWLKGILILDVINASNYFIVVAGVFLLVTAAFLLKGLRNAWWFAIILLSISFIGHLTKNVDYEDAFIALIILLVLIITRRQYYVRTNSHFRDIGLQTAIYCIAAVLIYGIVGFYSLDRKYFGTEFTFLQSIRYSFENYFLLESVGLNPVDAFSRHFLLSIHIGAIVSFSFLIYILVRPFVSQKYCCEEEQEQARKIVGQYGKSAIDYYKTQNDKIIFFPNGTDAFLAYRISANYAIVLENPVGENDNLVEQSIIGFEKYCADNSLKSIYFLVPEESLDSYQKAGKKSICIGQDAIINLSDFDLSSKQMSELNNIYLSFKEQGYTSEILSPSLNDNIIKDLEIVSDEWSKINTHSDVSFFKAQFSANNLKNQTVLTIKTRENKCIAFLNIIPGYSDEIPSFDLLRFSQNAPHQIQTFLLIELIKFLKEHGHKFLNLGFAPLQPTTSTQSYRKRSVKFATEKIINLPYFNRLREEKDKFYPIWQNKYLVYENDYDLLEVPSALTRVLKPV